MYFTLMLFQYKSSTVAAVVDVADVAVFIYARKQCTYAKVP